MIVPQLFELFIFRKIFILILLVVFNIAAFFGYDLVAKNQEILLTMQFPVSEEGQEIVNKEHFMNKYAADSVMDEILSGIDKTSTTIINQLFC